MSAPAQRSNTPLFEKLPPEARVLIVRLRSMGDSILLTGPLRALKAAFPRFRVSVLVEPRFAPCFAGNPDVDAVVTTGAKWATVRRLLALRFDAVVNLHGGPTSLVYCLAAGGRPIGLEGFQFGLLYSHLVPRDPVARHTVETMMGVLAHLGVRSEAVPPLRYETQAGDAAWVRANVGSAPYVVIHPAALMATKRWAPARFAEVGGRLAARGFRVVLTSGPGEEDVLTETARILSNSLILRGLTIPRLAELIRGASLYVGNDSGPMHLAAAVGTPTVAVWGSSDSTRWHPWRVPHQVVQNPFECNPCPGYRCLVAKTPLCIESVTIDQVTEAALALIAPADRVAAAGQESSQST